MLRSRALDPAGTDAGIPTAIAAKVSIPSELVSLTAFTLASPVSSALKTNVVLSFGVVIVQPRETVEPLIVIPELTRALFGRFEKVFSDPSKIEPSRVLFVIV